MSGQCYQIGVKGLIRNEHGEVLMVHVPVRNAKAAYWDLPGGRMETGENLLDTLERELMEEIGVTFSGIPKQLMTFLTNITILSNNEEIPLVFVIYEVTIADGKQIKINDQSAEDTYSWFGPSNAAEKMEFKYSREFCELVSKL